MSFLDVLLLQRASINVAGSGLVRQVSGVTQGTATQITTGDVNPAAELAVTSVFASTVAVQRPVANATPTITQGYAFVPANGNIRLANSAGLATALSHGGVVLTTAGANAQTVCVTSGPIDPAVFNVGAGVACALGTDANGKVVRVTDGACVSGLKYLGVCDANGAIYVSPRTSLVFDVTDFGAIGDGQSSRATANAAAFQAALDAAWANRQFVETVPGLQSMAKVHVPNGLFYVDPNIAVPAYVTVDGDSNAAIQTTSTTAPIFIAHGYYDTFRSLIFYGGRHAILFYGSSKYQGNPTLQGVTTIEKCVFRYQSGPSIMQDTTVNTGTFRRSTTAHFVVKNIDFWGPAFWYMCCDWARIDGAYIVPDDSLSKPVDANGRQLAVFNDSGNLMMSDVLCVPGGASISAFVQGNGTTKLIDVRFGGEAALVPVASITDVVYNGSPLMTNQYGPLQIFIDGGNVTSCFGAQWLEVYDVFPNSIDVRGVFGTPLISLDSNATANEYIPFISSSGIWIKNTVDMIEAAERDGVTLHFEGQNRTSAISRVRQSTSPAIVGVDVTDRVRRGRVVDAFDVQPWEEGPPQANLWFAGLVDIDSGDSGGLTLANISNGADTSTGYTLSKITATSDYGQVTAALYPVGVGPGWPASAQAAGEYCFSFWVKSSWPGSVIISRTTGGTNTTTLGVRTLAGNGWQRVSATFYHDGTNARTLEVSFLGIPNTQNIICAFFAVHAGAVPRPWTYPGNANGTAQMSIYQGTGAPGSGTYAKGDLVVNSAPTAGGTWAWVCTTAGTPGTWKTIAIGA